MDQKSKRSGRDILGYFLLGASIVMLGRSLMLCFSNDIWYDELFTVGMIEHSYGELIRFTARDVHPPLYYMITKFIVDLCKLISVESSTVVIAKIVSVLPYFGLLLYCITFIRKNFSIFTGGLFMFCAVAMPQLSGYTVEVRMYSWALLFVTAAFLHAYGTIHAKDMFHLQAEKAKDEECYGTDITGNDLSSTHRASNQVTGGRKYKDSGLNIHKVESGTGTERKRLNAQKMHGAALVCYGLAAAYTQYFACVAVVMVYLYVLLAFLAKDRHRIKEWLLWVIVSVVCYVPWLFALYDQITAVSADYWILPLSWRTFGGCVKFLMKPAFTSDVLNVILAVALFIIYVGVFVYRSAWCLCAQRGGCAETPGRFSFRTCISCLSRHKYSVKSTVQVSAHTCAYAHSLCLSKNKDSVKHGHGHDGEKDRENIIHFMFMAAGIGVLAGLVLFGYVASVLVRPIFVYRYMIPAMGCFWLSFAVGLDDIWRTGMMSGDDNDNKKKKIVDGLPLIIVLFIIIIGLRDYRAFMGEEEYKILLMRQTEEALSSIAPEDIIIYNFDQVQAVTSYYLPEESDSYLWCGTPETLIQEIVRPYDAVEDTATLRAWCEEGRKVWFIGSFNSRDDIVEEWEADGLHIEEMGSYLLERYWFNLYRIFI